MLKKVVHYCIVALDELRFEKNTNERQQSECRRCKIRIEQ